MAETDWNRERIMSKNQYMKCCRHFLVRRSFGSACLPYWDEMVDLRQVMILLRQTYIQRLGVQWRRVSNTWGRYANSLVVERHWEQLCWYKHEEGAYIIHGQVCEIELRTWFVCFSMTFRFVFLQYCKLQRTTSIIWTYQLTVSARCHEKRNNSGASFWCTWRAWQNF